MGIRKTVCGFCPEQDDEAEIQVDFTEVPIAGIGMQHVKTGYLCSYAQNHQCDAAGKSGKDCPLYKLCSEP